MLCHNHITLKWRREVQQDLVFPPSKRLLESPEMEEMHQLKQSCKYQKTLGNFKLNSSKVLPDIRTETEVVMMSSEVCFSQPVYQDSRCFEELTYLLVSEREW